MFLKYFNELREQNNNNNNNLNENISLNENNKVFIEAAKEINGVLPLGSQTVWQIMQEINNLLKPLILMKQIKNDKNKRDFVPLTELKYEYSQGFNKLMSGVSIFSDIKPYIDNIYIYNSGKVVIFVYKDLDDSRPTQVKTNIKGIPIAINKIIKEVQSNIKKDIYDKV